MGNYCIGNGVERFRRVVAIKGESFAYSPFIFTFLRSSINEVKHKPSYNCNITQMNWIDDGALPGVRLMAL